MRSEDEAVGSLRKYVKTLLALPPKKNAVIMGLAPLFYQGVKLAVINASGELIDSSIIHPFTPVLAAEEAIKDLAKLIIKHKISWVAIGSAKLALATKQLIDIVLMRYPDLACKVKIVDSVGADGCNASLSIARRLQDPRQELAKIDPLILGKKYLALINQERLIKEVKSLMQSSNKITPKPQIPRNTMLADALLKWKTQQ
ncbi:MAG: hypothetical protein A3F18_01085 [Legionellales bacterium RIFCSPHIGHO2_12_FULL_37_14]|nr:MAG: hypothetical protein A3F18_01085 [Legionellales bacterium RIFCSPHIGHO2_12_FULL_37_14]